MRTWTNPVKNVAWILTLLAATTSSVALAKAPARRAKGAAPQGAPATKPSSSAVTKPTAASATAPVASSASGPAVDCNERKNRNENGACKSAFKENTLGTGPHLFDQPGLSQDWANGYVDVAGNRLIVGGRWGDGDEKLGALISVDMSNGNRRVISGAAVSDPRRGSTVTGAGDELGQVRGVAAMPGNAAVVMSSLQSGRVDPMQLVRVDLATGARTSFWRADGKKGAACTPPIGASFNMYPGQIATDPSGNVYVLGGTAGVGSGVFKVSPDGTKCTVVSFAGSSLASANHRGQGPDWSTSSLQDVIVRDGKMFILDPGTRALYKVDMANGDREIVTRHGSPNTVGTGPYIALTGIDRLSDGCFVTQDNELVVMVDPQSGNRTKLDVANNWGPTRWQVWAIPNSHFGIAATVMGFVKVDFNTGNANLLSN